MYGVGSRDTECAFSREHRETNKYRRMELRKKWENSLKNGKGNETNGRNQRERVEEYKRTH